MKLVKYITVDVIKRYECATDKCSKIPRGICYYASLECRNLVDISV